MSATIMGYFYSLPLHFRSTSADDKIYIQSQSLAQQTEDYHTNMLYPGSTPETPTDATMAFKLKGKWTTIHQDSNDGASIHTFPTPHAPSMLAKSDNDSNPDNKIIPPEFDELCAPEAGAFPGDGYPCPVPSKSFFEKMAALGSKQILAVT